jgi:hypothetical protein
MASREERGEESEPLELECFSCASDEIEAMAIPGQGDLRL